MVPVSDISSCLPEVPIWLAIVGGSVLLLAAAGIISSALEIYVTLTSAAMAERLTCRIARQAALKGRETSCVGYAKLES